jgi:hypothetical protein
MATFFVVDLTRVKDLDYRTYQRDIYNLYEKTNEQKLIAFRQ